MPAGAFAQRLQELAEYFGAWFSGLANQLMGLAANSGRIVALAVGFQVLQVFGQVQPAVDQTLIQFQVALQAVRVLSVTQNLKITPSKGPEIARSSIASLSSSHLR
jgi:nitrate/nitrite transporter NarK